jgi:phosphoribosylglycinamide formyltransferase-1
VTYCTFAIRGALFDRYWEEIKGNSVDELIDRQGDDTPLFGLIRKEGVKRELPLVVATLKAFSVGWVRIENSRVIDAGGNAVEGYDLTVEIDGIISAQQ